MTHRLFVYSVAALAAQAFLAAPSQAVECSGAETAPWINEIDYDDFTVFPNGDRQEAVEIAGPAGTDLSGYRILAVEGRQDFFACGTGLFTGTGNAYFDSALPAGSVIPDDGDGMGFLVVCFNSTSTSRSAQCDATVPGVATDSNLKNGRLTGTANDCPDGVLLLTPGGATVDAVGYEGLMPNQGTYGPRFQSPQYNAGRDAGFSNFESLYKNSDVGRALSGTEWSVSGANNDTIGTINPGQVLVCDMFADADGDGVEDSADNCPDDANAGQQDADGDGVGDACNDADDADGDEHADSLDNCPGDANPSQANGDGDTLGDACDNCPADTNEGQEDTDADGAGDACNDADDADGDEYADVLDNCPADANPGQEDTDADGAGDACNDADDGDGDEYADALDNCPADSNPGQADNDADGVGNPCDNCPDHDNPGQLDSDMDGIGDACEFASDGPPPVPALPGAGLPVLGMLLLGAGAWAIRRTRRPGS